MTSAVLAYTNPNGVVKTITVRAPEFGNKDSTNPQQSITHTPGGATYVYSVGPRVRQLMLLWDNLTDTERADLEDFFNESNVNQSARWFSLTLTPTEREVLVCGASVGGVVVTCGTTYKCGQRVLQDSVTFIVRLVTPPFSWDEPGDVNGLFTISMTLEVMPTFLPDNS